MNEGDFISPQIQYINADVVPGRAPSEYGALCIYTVLIVPGNGSGDICILQVICFSGVDVVLCFIILLLMFTAAL